MKDFKRNQLGLAAVSVHGNKLKKITPMFDYLSSQYINTFGFRMYTSLKEC